MSVAQCQCPIPSTSQFPSFPVVPSVPHRHMLNCVHLTRTLTASGGYLPTNITSVHLTVPRGQPPAHGSDLATGPVSVPAPGASPAPGTASDPAPSTAPGAASVSAAVPPQVPPRATGAVNDSVAVSALREGYASEAASGDVPSTPLPPLPPSPPRDGGNND